MYKILIVDDEELVRRSIIRIVDWKALGFTEVYEAENGVDALKIALEVSPHLVLTDIRMPFMDGLQLTSKLKEQLPSTHIVILSGHDEFTYAQDAIGLGVLDYILKPLGAAALTAKMQAIRQTLDEDYQEKQYLAKVQTQLHQSLPLLKENFLNTLVCTPGSKIGLASRLNFLDIPLAKGPFAISVIEPDLSDISPSDIEVYNFSVKNIALETVGVSHPVFSENSGKVVIAFCIPALPAETDKRNSIIETLNVLQKSINIYLKISVTIGLGTTVDDMCDLYASYSEALSALDCKYVLGKNKIYDIYDLDYMETEFFYPFDDISEFIAAVKTFKTNTIEQTLLAICQLLKSKKNLSAANIKLVFIELATALLRLLTETKQMSTGAWSKGLTLYSEIENLGTIDEMAESTLCFAMDVSRELSELRTTSSKNVVLKAMEYVKDNYQLEKLSLNTAAVHTSVSSGYLSALFKKEGNINFSDYVTKVRMEKAMELLRTTYMKTYEIAYCTGFSNPHYFSISFKKYTGMSPSEYRGDPEK